MSRKRGGFTLAEILVALVIFAIFSTGLIATVNLALAYWRQTSSRTLSEQNARRGLATITTEFRQSLLCPIQGVNANPGLDAVDLSYLDIEPTGLAPTNILMPNANPGQDLTAELIFVEPSSRFVDPTRDPETDIFNPNNAGNYQRIRYFVSADGRNLRREVTAYQDNPLVDQAILPPTVEDVCRASAEGAITLQVTWLTPNRISVSITARERNFSNAFVSELTTPSK